MRRSIVLALPLLAAAVTPSLAAPASTARVVAGGFQLPVSRGVLLDVQLRAIDTADGARLRVAVMRCATECDLPRYYEGALPAGALSVATGTGESRLRTALGGVPLTMTWTPEGGPSASAGGLQGGGRGEDSSYTAYAGTAAAVRVATAQGACTGSGSVGDAVRLQTSDGGNGAALPLRRLRLRPAGAPVCPEGEQLLPL